MRSSRRTRAQPPENNDAEQATLKSNSIRSNIRFTPSPAIKKATKATKVAKEIVKKAAAPVPAKRVSLSGVTTKVPIRKTTAKRGRAKKDEPDQEDKQDFNEGDTFDLETKTNGDALPDVPDLNGEVAPAKVKLPAKASRSKQPAKAPPKPKSAPVRKAPTRGKKVEDTQEEVVSTAAAANENQEQEVLMEEDDLNKSETKDLSIKSAVSIPEGIDFASLKLEKVINDSTISKMITFQGTYNGKTAVVQLEKTLFNEAAVKKSLGDKKTTANQDFINDIYSSYIIEPTSSSNSLNSIKATVVCPASESVLTKYSRTDAVFFCENVDAYIKVVEPFIANKLANDENYNKWVYNILDGVSEAERIILNDPDPDSGFVLTPDLKWAGDEKDLYLVAICHRRDIRSLRDLHDGHMVLLMNILTKGTKAIKDRFKKHKGHLRAYIHYQPSFYHFHVHFKTVDPNDYRSTDRDHLLSTVINNITLNKDYYKKASLTYPLSVSSALYQDLKKAKRV